MNDGVTKRIVVLKNLPSNIIEEAILILKTEPGQKERFKNKGKAEGKTVPDNNYLLKEAHAIINDYIRQNAIQSIQKKEAKAPLIKNRKFMVNIVINIALVGSIAIFILMLSKLF